MPVGDAQDGDHERDVALDRGDHLADVRALLADDAQHAVAGLGERGEVLERLEGGGQAPAVALVVATRGIGADGSATRREEAAAAWGMVQCFRSGRGIRGRVVATSGHLSAGMDESLSPRTRPPARWVSALPTRVGRRPLRRLSARSQSAASMPPQRLVAAQHRRASRRSPARPSCPRARRAAAGRRRAACAPRASTTPRSARRSRRPPSPRRAAAPARRARRRAPRARPRRATSRARPRVVGRPVEDEARERPEVGERLDLLLADRDRRRPSPSRPVNASRRASARRSPARAGSGRSSSAASARRTAPGSSTRAARRSARTSSSVAISVSSSPSPQPSSAR